MRAILSVPAFAVTVTMLGCPGSAIAQDGWGWSVIIPSVTGTDQLGIHLREQISPQRDGGDPAPKPRASMSEGAAPDVSSLRYTPSKARRTANLARFVEATRRTDPATAATMQKQFASGDFIEKIGEALARHGMRVDDLSDAYTVWWITAWQATKGSSAETSQATNQAVRRQAAAALGEIGAVARASDAAKQELAESLFIQTVLIEAMVEQSKGDPARLDALAAAVNQGARGMGIDLSTMELTERGFVTARQE